MNSTSSCPQKPMPLLSITSSETIQKCASLPLRPNDIFICSYPKSGTTWMQHIVLSLLFQHQRQHQQQDAEKSECQSGGDCTTRQITSNNNTNVASRSFYSHVSEYAPFFEIDPHWNNDTNDLVPWIQENHARIGRRIFNTHLRFDMLPKPPSSSPPPLTQSSPSKSQHQSHHQESHYNDNQPPDMMASSVQSTTSIPTTSVTGFGKFIYLVRSPLDACVSFYHHLSHQVQGGHDGGSLDDFFREWLLGDTIPFGSWIDHVQSYIIAAAAAAVSESSLSSNGNTDTTNYNNKSQRRVVRLVDGREFFFVTYEEMCGNLSAIVSDLRDFLDLSGPSTKNRITDNNNSNDDELLLQTFSFAYMKANQERFQPKSVEWKNNFSFLRNGVPGDASNVITKEQHEQFRVALENSPLWQQLLDEKDDDNNAVVSLRSKIKRLLVAA